MKVSLPDLYEILSVKLGKDEAKVLTTYVEEKVDHKLENVVTSSEFHKGLNDLERHLNSKIWTLLITLVVMILGMYAAIFLKK